MPSEYNPNLVASMEAKFRRLYNPAHSLAESISIRQALPGLVALYTTTLGGGSGNNTALTDKSGNGLHLTRNGNPVLRLLGDTSPSVAYDGTGDYHSIAHNANFGIIGSEGTIHANYRGLTICGWIRISTLGTAVQFAGKANNTADADTNNAYSLVKGSGNNVGFYVWDGSGNRFIGGSIAMAVTTWYFVAGVYDPSASVKIYVCNGGNVVTGENTTSIPATINNPTGTAFSLGGAGGGSNLLTGNMNLWSVYSAALPDYIINMLYNIDRPTFND